MDFSQRDPISILAFPEEFCDVCDSIGIHDKVATWLLLRKDPIVAMIITGSWTTGSLSFITYNTRSLPTNNDLRWHMA